MAAPELAAAEPESDEELVDRLRKGDQTAFEVLYERYFKRVFYFLDKRLRNRADTEETTQEVFVNLFNSIDSYRGDAPFAAWVFGVSRRTLASRFKKKRHPTVSIHDMEGDSKRVGVAIENADSDPLAAYECQERMERLERVLESELTPEQSHLFKLHHLEHHSIQEIARAIAKTEDAVKSNLYRARKVLLAC